MEESYLAKVQNLSFWVEESAFTSELMWWKMYRSGFLEHLLGFFCLFMYFSALLLTSIYYIFCKYSIQCIPADA